MAPRKTSRKRKQENISAQDDADLAKQSNNLTIAATVSPVKTRATRSKSAKVQAKEEPKLVAKAIAKNSKKSDKNDDKAKVSKDDSLVKVEDAKAKVAPKKELKAASKSTKGTAKTTAKTSKSTSKANTTKQNSTTKKPSKTEPKKEVKKQNSQSSPNKEPEEPKKKTTTFQGLVPVNLGESEVKLLTYGKGNADFMVVSFSEYALTKDKRGAFHAMLNQTNIGQNNNKYYLCQILQNINSKVYFSYFRWGRVGKIAGTTLTPHGTSLDSAYHVFCKKFNDKSKNDFYSVCVRDDEFVKYANKYELIEMDYGEENEEEDEGSDESDDETKAPECTLMPEVQNVMKLICDLKRMENEVRQMNFDTTRTPLGKITKDQIDKGYRILAEIEEEILKDKKKSQARLSLLTSSYYTRVPHDFGMKVPPVISNIDHLQEELDLLEVLADIEIVTKLIKVKKPVEKIHQIDDKYNQLRCGMDLVNKNEEKMISNLLKYTHASTHSYYNEIKLINAFKLNASTQNDKTFKPFLKYDRKLLWHGTRVTNMCGILSQGLRIAPPSAPVTGYMFGKGVYFADSCSKSANYCHPSASDPERFLFLADVAIGQPHKLYTSSYKAEGLMKSNKKDSILGVGRYRYDKAGEEKFGGTNGAKIPKIQAKTSGCVLKDEDPNNITCLMYNEFIIYNVLQVNLKYMCHVKFEFGSNSSYW